MSEHEPLLEPFDQATLAAIKTPFRRLPVPNPTQDRNRLGCRGTTGRTPAPYPMHLNQQSGSDANEILEPPAATRVNWPASRNVQPPSQDARLWRAPPSGRRRFEGYEPTRNAERKGDDILGVSGRKLRQEA
jgi:hypothetical protein